MVVVVVDEGDGEKRHNGIVEERPWSWSWRDVLLASSGGPLGLFWFLRQRDGSGARAANTAGVGAASGQSARRQLPIPWSVLPGQNPNFST